MVLKFLLGISLVGVFCSQVGGLTKDQVINNVGGYQMERDSIYMIMAPRKVRPNQVYQVFCTILKLEYGPLNVRISITKDNVEYAEMKLGFDQPGSRIMQLYMPANAQAGNYQLRAEGTLMDGDGSGYIFINTTDLAFEPKQASLFIQLSKPIYKQQQTVQFRVIPILPNLMPKYGSMTIYVLDPTGFPVRRWLGLQTNAGGFVSQSFQLSDQPNYGNWTIQVDAHGYTYNKSFQVEEYWDVRFDINVTVAPYIFDNMQSVSGSIMSNITTGKPVVGQADILLTIIPPKRYPYLTNPMQIDNQMDQYPQIYKAFDYFRGQIGFSFTREEILHKAQQMWPVTQDLIDFELMFNVTAKDWYFNMTQKAFASTVIVNPNVKLIWIGDAVRTFKPDSVLTAHVAVMRFDGTPVLTNDPVLLTKRFTYRTGGGAGGLNQEPEQKIPLNGIASFDIALNREVDKVELTATWNNDPRTQIILRATRYYSPSESYITVRTSTENPQVNEYMVFHVRTSMYVPKVYYQVVASGNILIGDELEMISRYKTFAIALSRDMIPMARMVVYYLESTLEEVVVDSLNFFVNGTRSNVVNIVINRGQDFTRDTIQINALADPGSYVAISAMPNELYIRGLNDGLTENNLIDELMTYDMPAKGSYRLLWRLSETEYQYKFFTATGYGIDANTTFRDAGLLVLSDASMPRINNECDRSNGFLPCFDGTCYHVNLTCNGVFDCPNDWADEQGCVVEDPRYNNRIMNMIERVSRYLRFYEESSWAWQEQFVKPDGQVQIRLNVSKYPLSWVINGLSISRDNGLGLMQRPIKYDATRYMYIIVESPDLIVRGEQIGVRVTVFNYWYNDDYLEVLITMHDGGEDYSFVWVEEMGITKAYNPKTVPGDHQTLVFLEPGESKDIMMPIVSSKVQGEITFTVSASCFMERDSFTKTVRIQPDGVMNYYHTPYLVDMIRYGSETIPDLQIEVPDQFVVPEVRYHLYVPGSANARLSLFGDVVTPGFFKDYLTAESIFLKPYGGGEMNMFNFAYNLLTLRFKKANQQLSPETLKTSLSLMNIGLQRQLSYMKDDGSFKMFRDDENSSTVWLTAFVAKTFHEARFGEWERDMFIPVELINAMVVWLCSQQNETGAWYPTGPVYDRKLSSIQDSQNQKLYGHPIPLTAYVLIALYTIGNDLSGDALRCVDKSKQMASEYLSSVGKNTLRGEVFHLAITAYALSLSQQKSRELFDQLWVLRRTGSEFTYFADSNIPDNPSAFVNTVRYLKARLEQPNEAYAVQSTAYALMAHIIHNGMGVDTETKFQRDSMMKWLNTMRNYVGGFASTQDTLIAMEALFAYTQVDPNRNVFNMLLKAETSATPDWSSYVYMSKDNYTELQTISAQQDRVYGTVRVIAQGTGRAMMQLTTTVHVEYDNLIKKIVNDTEYFEITNDNIYFTGRNFSVMEMTPCVRWLYTDRSLEAGLTVLEVDIPTGFVVMNDTLRQFVKSGVQSNLKRAEFYDRKVVLYFSHLDTSKTCVPIRADRWYPVANMTIQHKMRVYDYYEPGMYKVAIYTTYNMFNLNICYVCGSYQCPYCPFFNVASVIKASFTLLALILGFFLKRYLLRTS
ncbi:hypothetical protein ACJMK2_009340 [Sinanodonta woodiana]|uniref:CD109 antigen n=1 Tax=Sinanodonta woodiana TaxID=1069815 RepID=A0ABD3VC14_SINWO